VTDVPIITDGVWSLADLRADPRNAKRHTEQQIRQIMTSIERFGFIEKIVIRPDGQLIGGEGRLIALRRLGRDEVECRIVSGLSEARYAALGLALNRIAENSTWDDDTLRGLVADLDEGGEDLLGVGFNDREITKLLGEPDPIEVKQIETGDVDDEFWISIRGPLAHQAEALRALEAAMKPFAGVTVDLGTIAVNAI
jgi:ParB-like chromosome segregation protein Spo0J